MHFKVRGRFALFARFVIFERFTHSLTVDDDDLPLPSHGCPLGFTKP